MSKRTVKFNPAELAADIDVARVLGLTTLLSVLEQAIDAGADAEAEAARHLVSLDKQQRHLARLTKVCDEFHTGRKAPSALDYNVIGGVTGAPSYNELARLHRNQRELIQQYQQEAKKPCAWQPVGTGPLPCLFLKETA